jgi:polygalacturonase
MIFMATFLFFGATFSKAAQYDLKTFGAISNDASLEAAQTNGAALYTGLAAMEAGDELVVSKGDRFFLMPPANTTATNCSFVTLVISGTILLHNDSSSWPTYDNGKKLANAIDVQQSRSFTVTGGGTIDGQGHSWWWKFLLGKVSRYRPTLLNLAGCVDCLVENLLLKDSPRFHFYGSLLDGLEVRNMTVRVDVVAQRDLVERSSGVLLRGVPPFNDEDHPQPSTPDDDEPIWGTVPCFPFNTDGIDVEGRDIHVHNVTVNNYDDSVCVKPVYSPGLALGVPINATENVLVENVVQVIGAGISVGSVPPNLAHPRVVRNVTFRSIVAFDPLKLAYIKTGGGDGTGSISDITYDGVTATGAVVSPIYLGPQQQSEPDGDGAGWWPQTEPAVSISKVSFRNINVTGGLSSLSAGVLRCNISNPCRDITFENVLIDRNRGYICDEPGTVLGEYDDVSSPSLSECVSSV